MAKVLLVEDDNNLREIYEARLVAEGYDITSAQDGEEALVVAKAEKPDLIISDVMMPKISGFEMLDILRNTQGLKETKVIMLTALGQADDRTRADSLGADRYLVKSQVTLEDIVKAAHELLEGGAAPAEQAADITASDPIPVVAQAPIPAEPTPEVAPAPTPEIAVSAPPAEVQPAPAPAPEATPVATVVPEVATPTAVEPAAPASPEISHTFAPTTPADQSATTTDSPAASDPVATTQSADAPATDTPVEPAATEPSTESSPTIELPSLPTTDSSTEPAAEPVTASTDIPAEPTLPESESTADEQAMVNTQIEDFIKNNAVEVPSEAPASPAPNNITDQIMKESVDTLIASAEHSDNGPVTPSSAPEAPAEPTPAPEPKPAPQEVDDSSENDGVTIAHKKVIARPDSAATKPDLGELLAREDAKKIVLNEAPAVTSEAPAPIPATPSGNGEAVLPGNTFTPTNGTATPKPGEDVDPNSIAL